MSQTYVNIITRILKVSIRKNRRKSQQKIILCANIMVPSRNLKVPHTRRCRTMAEKESSGPEDWETQFWVGLRRVFTSSYPLLFILLSLLLSPPTSSKKPIFKMSGAAPIKSEPKRELRSKPLSIIQSLAKLTTPLLHIFSLTSPTVYRQFHCRCYCRCIGNSDFLPSR